MAYLICVAGGTASGKTSTCNIIMKTLIERGVRESDIALISMDSFYRGLDPDDNPEDINFDHPSSFDLSLLYSCLIRLIKGTKTEIPIYDFSLHRAVGSNTVEGSGCIIVEGILPLYDEKIRDLFDMKIFVDTASDIRLIRRIRRDIQERGRSLESVLEQCEKTVIPSYDQFIEPTKKYADLIIPRGKSNHIAINLMVDNIYHKLNN